MILLRAGIVFASFKGRELAFLYQAYYIRPHGGQKIVYSNEM